MASPPNTGDQPLSPSNANASQKIKKCGYLKKQKHGHKRFFVLREPSEGLPSRLEYYESEKKWKNKSAAKRVIPLDCCLNINKRADAKHKYLIALYTKDEYFAVAADSEPEQESWHRALTDLMAEGKVYDGSASNSASSLVGFDEASYGVITPVSAAYKEMWQVNLKSKGLGQSRNLIGVYRLCLSSRTISFVKLNSEVASVILQLMNIRRCGHSDSFFFIEVGRSATTGPGEFWMQADDSVVAQNIHETILEAMKAMKELSEFRPRSKSQSSGTNPISVPTRRHLNHHPPPSQTGLTRRSRTDSVALTSPVSKLSSCRIRTASEGDGTMARPMSVTGSPLSPGVHRTLLTRSHTISMRPCRTFESSSLQHSKSMSMPRSPTPPIVSNGLGNVSSCPESGAPRPSSCTASFSGSPSDAGFISSEEYGSSPADARDPRLLLTLRSNTPESLKADTPPSRDGSELEGYMVMERQNGYRRLPELDKAYRKRTYSLTTPRQQRGPPQVSSASLDEYTLMRATYSSGSQASRRCHTSSPKGVHPEDFRDVQISVGGLQGDSGYMPMMPGVALQTPWSRHDPYMPMSPMCVSAPKQIINPRSHSSAGLTPHTNSPGSVSLEDSGYMRMLCGTKMSVESTDGKLTNGEYLNMSPVDPLTPPDYILSFPGGDPHPQQHHKQPYSLSSLPRSLKGQLQRNGSTDKDQYVLMCLQGQRIEEESNYCPVPPGDSVAGLSPVAPSNHSSAPSPLRATRVDGGLGHQSRLRRPTRLALESLRTLPCMSEHPLPSEPRSPGEYINIDYSSAAHDLLASTASASSVSSMCAEEGSLPLSDYANIDVGSPGHLDSQLHGGSPTEGCLNQTPEVLACPSLVNPPLEEQKIPERQAEERGMVEEYPPQQQVCLVRQPAPVKDDYTEMTFSPLPLATAPLPAVRSTEDAPLPTSLAACVKRLSLETSIVNGGPPSQVDSFLLGGPSLSVTLVDPHRGAKVIRADPQGRRRHSSETFSSTTTVTPVCPSFAHDTKRHSSASVENVSHTICSSEGSDEDYGSNSPMCREMSAGYQNGLNYIALNLMEGNLGGCRLGGCDGLLTFKTTACGCKGGLNGFNTSPYASMGFKETATAVKE
ncbi:irs2 [Pungitius sinensis]